MTTMMRLISIILLSVSLQACVGSFMAGAAVGGAVAYEGRNMDVIKQDMKISSSIDKKFKSDPQMMKSSRIVTATYDGTVLLVGQTPYPHYKQQAEQMVKSIPGVKRVYNEIVISGPISAMTESSDAWITTKVKSHLIAAKGLDSAQIKVVTENGVVYLIGKVTHSQAKIATAAARNVSGVQKVVTLFEYVKP